VSFLINTETVYAHKIILATRCSIFQALFDEHKNSNVIEIQHTTAKAFIAILNYLYSTQVSIKSIETAWEILKLSEQFKLFDLQPHVESYLKLSITFANVCTMWKSAGAKSLASIENYCLDKCIQEFELVCDQDNFLELTKDQIIEILKSDNLNVKEESVAYKASVRWLNAKQNDDPSSEILHYVRFYFINTEFYNAIVERDNRVSSQFKEEVAKAIEDISVLQDRNNPRYKARAHYIIE